MGLEINEITGMILDAAIKLHRELGPGLLETVYEQILAASLQKSGLVVDRQWPVDITHDGMRFYAAFRIDLFVEKCVIVEIKSTERRASVHAKQLLTYLRLTNQPVGLLINFGGETLKEGVERVVNNYRS